MSDISETDSTNPSSGQAEQTSDTPTHGLNAAPKSANSTGRHPEWLWVQQTDTRQPQFMNLLSRKNPRRVKLCQHSDARLRDCARFKTTAGSLQKYCVEHSPQPEVYFESRNRHFEILGK